jgi:hypothetical protein
MLARDRINGFVLHFGYETGGFLTPCYPYFLDVEGYPDVKMANVTPQQQQRNLTALNHLIKMAHDRGLTFTLGIWNHVNRGVRPAGGAPVGAGAAGGGGAPAGRGAPTTGVQPTQQQTRSPESAGAPASGVPFTGVQTAGQTPVSDLVKVSGVTHDNVTAYTKAALAKFLTRVPDLDGIWFQMHGESGLTAGELEAFWLDVFRTLKETKTAPPRLYFHSKGLPDPVVQSAVNVGLRFDINPKYWMEQMGMPWHPTHINRQNQFDRRHGYADWLVYPKQYDVHWDLWTGGTVRVLLWGDPQYVRRFAATTHLYDGDGYNVNEPVGTKMHGQPHDEQPFDLLNPRYAYYDYEFERYWYFFQVFGRIGYNPDQSPDIWHKEFEKRFGVNAGPIIETALQQASWILPRIVAHPYPYRLFPTTMGWAEKQRMFDLPTYATAEGSDIQQFANSDEEARILVEGGETAKLLPSMTSLWLEQTSSGVNGLIAKAEEAIGNNRNKEFDSTITDLKILANLALYHSRRIPAAVTYRIFVRTQDVSALDKAIACERNAIDAWRQIVAAAGDVYASNLKFGPDYKLLSGHWKDELRYLEQDLAALEQQRRDFKPEGPVKRAPEYKAAASTDNGKLFQVSFVPVTSVPLGKPVTIRVKVTAAAGVKWVHLLSRSVNQTADYRTVNMVQAGATNSFEATVPAEEINSKYDFMYLIEVMDNQGRGKIYPDMNNETPYVFVKVSR